MNNRGGLFPVFLLLIVAVVFAVIVFTNTPNQRKITLSGFAVDSGIAEKVSGMDYYLITNQENPSQALFSNGEKACESVSRSCNLIKVNCSNIDQGSEWEASSANCLTLSEEYSGCVYAAECLDESGNSDGDSGANDNADNVDLLKKIKESLSQTSIIIIVIILVIAIIVVVSLLLKRFNEE